MRTGEDVLVPGLYLSSCCDEELTFKRDDCFKRCPRCERLCEWELAEELVAQGALEQTVENGRAA